MTSNVTIQSRVGLSGQPRTIVAKLGQHIRTDPRPIARHCLRTLAVVSEDITTIVESLAFADRFQTRQRARTWTRRIDLEIPVYEYETFAAPSVHASLTDTAAFLSGDDWRISFVRRSGAPLNESYLPLINEQPDFVIPFSNGLDSFAQSKLLRAEHGTNSVWEIRAGKLQRGSERNYRPVLEVPRGFRAGHPRELTYRTRPLVYFSLAALGAATVGAKAIVIGENGQGSLGPSFARFGNEWPFRSAHPGFVTRLADFLTRALNFRVEFRQPQLWRTKGEVLSELKARDLLADWERTRSCSMRPLQRRGRQSCGLCGGCLLRLTALNAAGIEHEWDLTFDVRSPDLVIGTKDGSIAQMGQNEKEILTRSALSMTNFAEFLLKPHASEAIAREARDIPGLPTELAHMRISSLIQRHATEWRSLLAKLPRDAWLNRQFSNQ